MSNNLSEKQKNLFENIKNSYINNNLIPFIGSGFSKNAGDNFPDWNEFVEKLFEELPYYNKKKLNKLFPGASYPVDAPELYGVAKYRKLNPNDVNIYDKDKVRKIITNGINKIIHNCEADVTKSKAHELLVKMFPIIYTTNWDNFIETAMKAFCGGKNCISSLSDYCKKKDPKYGSLIKMHGSIAENDDDAIESKNMVVTTNDYMELLHDQHPNYPLSIKFQNESFQKDFLFIGFSFTDRNINNLLYPISACYKKTNINENAKPKVYMISFNERDKILAEYYKEFKNVDIYFIDVTKEKITEATIQFLFDLKFAKWTSILEQFSDPAKKNEILLKEVFLLNRLQREKKCKMKVAVVKTEFENINKKIEKLKTKIIDSILSS